MGNAAIINRIIVNVEFRIRITGLEFIKIPTQFLNVLICVKNKNKYSNMLAKGVILTHFA